MARRITSGELAPYGKHYSENALWKKLGRFAKRIGVKMVYYILVLYYALIDPNTPAKYKIVIAGALGYLILPFDLLPDGFPFAGFADDWGALLAAVAFVATSITEETKARAKVKLRSWFHTFDNADLGDLA